MNLVSSKDLIFFNIYKRIIRPEYKGLNPLKLGHTIVTLHVIQ